MKNPDARLARHSDCTAPPAERIPQDPYSILLKIPGDLVKELGPNRTVSLHWAEKGRRVEAWKNKVWLAWKQQGRHEFKGKVDIFVTIYRGRKVDDDNAIASCKSAIDGLKGRAIVDDSPEHIRSLSVQVVSGKEWRDNPWVWMLIVEAGDSLP